MNILQLYVWCLFLHRKDSHCLNTTFDWLCWCTRSVWLCFSLMSAISFFEQFQVIYSSSCNSSTSKLFWLNQFHEKSAFWITIAIKLPSVYASMNTIQKAFLKVAFQHMLHRTSPVLFLGYLEANQTHQEEIFTLPPKSSFIFICSNLSPLKRSIAIMDDNKTVSTNV